MMLESRSRLGAMPPRRRSVRQEELLDGLEALARSDGFYGLGVGEIAARLKCSRSTLYAIAPSREQLFLVLVDRLLQRIQTAAVAGAEPEREPMSRLEGYLAGALEHIRGVGTTLLGEIQDHPQARQRLAEFQRTTIAHLCALIEAGIEEGAFQPVNAILAAELLDAAASRIQDPRVLAETGLSASDALADVIRVVTRGLLK